MAIDASIYSQIQRPQQQDSLERYAKALQIQGLQRAGEMDLLKADEYKRGVADQSAQRSAVQGFGDDVTANYNRLLQTGNLKAAQDYQKSVTDQQKSKADAAKAFGELLKQNATTVFANPNERTAIQAVENFGRQTGQNTDQLKAQIYGFRGDPTAIKQWAAGHALEADKMLSKYETRNLGGTTDTIGIDPVTGQAKTVNSVQNTQSPDNKASVGASYANAAATRAVASATRDAASIKSDRDTEMKLADDWRAQSKDFRAVGDAYRQINSTLDKATTSPAATLAAATKFMKLLDPGSVVRESELGMALQASGVFDRATNYFNTLQRGKVLTPTQVADFKNITQQIYGAAQAGQKAVDSEYTNVAKTYGLRPETIVQKLGQDEAPKPAMPKEFASMPDPAKLTGKRVQADDGTIYKSDGKKWVRQP